LLKPEKESNSPREIESKNLKKQFSIKMGFEMNNYG
jgi:hypothetical protein